MNKSIIEHVNLATMSIADKVNNYIQTYFYKIQLSALQIAAEKIGGAFIQYPHLDGLPPEVEEHLAYAVILVREAKLHPKDSSYDHYLLANRRMEDGYAVALLREIFAVLNTLGLHLYVRPDVSTLEVIEAEIFQWEMAVYITQKSIEDFGVTAAALLSWFLKNDKMHNIPVDENERI